MSAFEAATTATSPRSATKEPKSAPRVNPGAGIVFSLSSAMAAPAARKTCTPPAPWLSALAPTHALLPSKATAVPYRAGPSSGKERRDDSCHAPPSPVRVKRIAAPAPASAPGAPTSTDMPVAVRLVPKASPPRPSSSARVAAGTAPVAGKSALKA